MAVLCSASSRALLGLAALLCALPVLNAAPMIFGEGDELSAMFNVARTRLPQVEQEHHGSSHHASSANERFQPPPSPTDFGVPQASSDVFEYRPGDFSQNSPGSWADYHLAGHPSRPSGEASTSWFQLPDPPMHYGQGGEHFSGERFSVGTSGARMTHRGIQQEIDTSYPFAPTYQAGHHQAQAGPSQLHHPDSQLYQPWDPAALGQLEEWNAIHHAQPDAIGHPLQWDHKSNVQMLDTSGLGQSHPSQPFSSTGRGVEAGSQAPSDPYPRRGQRRKPVRPTAGSLPVSPIPEEQLREENLALERAARTQVEKVDREAFQKLQSFGVNVHDYAQLDEYLKGLSEAELQDLGERVFSDTLLLVKQVRMHRVRDSGSISEVRRRPIVIATAVQRALYQALMRKAVVKANDLRLPDAADVRMEANPKIAVFGHFFEGRNDKMDELLGSVGAKENTLNRPTIGSLSISLGPYVFRVGNAVPQLSGESGTAFPVTAYPMREGFSMIDMGLLVLPRANDKPRIHKKKVRAN